MLVNNSINIRSINNIDLPIILYKPNRNVSQIIDKWWPNCKNMLILQRVYPRVDQHFWDGPEMVVNIFILWHGDQANFGQKRLPTCWHSLSPASFFFCFTILEKLVKFATIFFHNKLFYCSVLRNIYYSHFCKNLVLLIWSYHCVLSRNVVTVVSVS